jgi:thymidine kinase
MLMELERYRYQHKKVAVFKPQIDTRYSNTDIVTHGGWSHSAICVSKGADILQHMLNAENDVSVVAVDEAFMIPGIADVLVFLYQSGFSIVVSSLDIAANGKPFPEIVQMLPWATTIVKCTAVCTVCGRDAHFTYKKQEGGDELTVEVGGSDLYEPRCFYHFPVILNRFSQSIGNEFILMTFI